MRSAAPRTPSSVGSAIALAVSLAWAFRSVLEFTRPNYVEPVTVMDWIAVVSFSVALALLAAAAWLIAELSGRRRPVVAAASILAIGSVVAAIANFIEDGLGVQAFGEVFAYGLFGVLAGLIGLAVTLVRERRYFLAALSVATFAGLFMSMEAGGGFLILAAWLLVAVGLWRRVGMCTSA